MGIAQYIVKAVIFVSEICRFEVNGHKVGPHAVHLLKKQVALLIIVFCGCMWVLLQIDFSRTATIFKFDKYGKTDYSSSGFLIDTKGCRILDLDPFDPSLVQYFGDEEPIDCNPHRLGSLVKSEVTTSELYVDQSVVRNYTKGSFTCCYKPFKRKELRKNKRIERSDLTYPSDVDDKIDYSKNCYEFSNRIVITDEFVKVTCTEGGREIYKEFFAFPKNPYKQGDPEFGNGLNTNKLSVLMIGLDGMSRLNFLRQMPRTIEFLETREAIGLLGYNKVGYNTFPNLVPVLIGCSEEELPKICWPTEHSVFDNCTFVWDLFKKKGYVTSYGEDTPTMGTFYYLKRGFRKKPVDFYPRPYSLEAEAELGSNHRLNVDLCTGKKLSSQVFNDLIRSFSYNMKDQLTFSFYWGNSLGHDYLNLPRVGDGDFKSLLSFMETHGIFNRTMVILLSDHGIRWGSFRTTYQGFLEERLPFVYFLFPSWFREQYPSAINNLKVNRKRLTSPYDLHETLKDVLDLSQISEEGLKRGAGKTGRGISLFRMISTDRKCNDAGIPDEWCACHTNKPLSIRSNESQEAAAGLIFHINSLLKGYRQCSTLKISKLVNIMLEEVPNKEDLKYAFKNYIVTLETTPGNGLFEDYSSSGFLIDTKGCRILDLDPFDPSLVQYFGDEEPIDCNPDRLGSLVKSEVTTSELYVDQTVVRNYTSGFFSCCYKPFKRKEVHKNKKTERSDLTYPSDVDEKIDYSEFCYEFSDNVVVTDEFVKVTCTEGGREIYKEFFAFPKNPYKQGDPEFKNGRNSDKLSVLMIGFDGMSRLNFLRQMPRTIEFLEKREVISLLGYNKVGYNTFPNVLPVLTGYSERKLPKICWPTKHSVFDNCTFIWDLFKKKGYVTSYGEDTPTMGTFYYLKRGFRKKPVDFYPRPYSLEAEAELGSNHRLNVDLCTGKKLSSQVFNGLIRSFTYNMRDQLTFAFFWGNSLTHDYLNLPRVGDGDFKSLLSFMESHGVFNKTMVVLLSDHGIRWGDFRTTYQGFLEERLPFVYFLFPSWFREQYPSAINNLKVNRKRLTSPFDLHKTLKDVLDLSQISDEALKHSSHQQAGLGSSLFRSISTDRTCKDAGIPDEWCACHTNKPLPISSRESQEAAASVVLQINSLLSGYRQCSTLKISKLVNARLEEVPNKESLKYSFKDYIVTLETTPGNGLFEATVRYKLNAGFIVLGAVSRLNMYGNQSSCISNYALKLYCFCEDQWGF